MMGTTNNVIGLKGSEKVQKAKLALLTMVRHQWEHGTAAGAFIESGDDHITILMAHEAAYRQMSDGRLAGVAHTTNITDPCVCGESVMFAYEKTGDAFYKKAADKMLDYIDNAPADANGIQLHNSTQPMIAADCMYMVPTFYAVMGCYDKAVKQVDLRFNLLWDDGAGAVRHQWNVEKGCWWRDKIWGAASGWNAAALVKILKLLPPGMGEERARLTGYLGKIVSGVLKYQLDNGLFYDVLDEGDESFVETNCAQMMAYSIYRGYQYGFLDVKYIAQADRMRAAANAKVDEYGFVRDVAGAPSFNSPGVSPEGQAFYIMMEAAAEAVAAI
ncbi:MAG: glycoside hydrolase family 88 protein [Oscillospiraceae bacterium]|nr:glycoside hydrolase family 88 protein [Oscillospiraceae bacterium]